MDTDTSFRVVGPDAPTTPKITSDQLDANLARAADHPGQWCVLATYATDSGASAAATRLRRRVDTPATIQSHGRELMAKYPEGE